MYDANRSTVGSDPDLILPGQRLNLRGKGQTPAHTESPSSASKKRKTPDKPSPHKTSPHQPSSHKTSSDTAKRTDTLVAPVHAATHAVPRRRCLLVEGLSHWVSTSRCPPAPP